MNTQKNTEEEAGTMAFWHADDIIPEIDDLYLQRLHIRLGEMVWHLYNILPSLLRPTSISTFITEEIANVYKTLCRTHIFSHYHDSTRSHLHVEDTYFAWLKQRTLTKLFFPAISYILQTPATAFFPIEQDIFISKAFPPQQSLLIHVLDDAPLRLDILFAAEDRHQIPEKHLLAAKKYHQETGYTTLFLYLDLLKNQGAILPLEQLITRETQIIPLQAGLQKAAALCQKDFTWRLAEIPPIYPEEICFASVPQQRKG